MDDNICIFEDEIKMSITAIKRLPKGSVVLSAYYKIPEYNDKCVKVIWSLNGYNNVAFFTLDGGYICHVN